MQNSKPQFNPSTTLRIDGERSRTIKIKNFYFLVIVFSFSFFIFNFCQATVLYLDSSSGQYHQGETFIVEARIDTEGECINTVKGDLSFSQDILEAIDFSQGNSILNLWLKPPEINQDMGLVSFIGGIPGGYCGRLAGDSGLSNLLGKIIFNVKRVNGGQISAKIEFLDSSQVLLNDGFGTPAKLTLEGMALKILAVKGEIPESEWEKELKEDAISPEPFNIEINKDSSVFEGKYFITFSTTDKQTGIDYYEIKEIPPIWKLKIAKWQEAESPYLLKDQSLRSIIKVKAVDKAGNERIAEYLPPKKPIPYWIIVLILGGAGVIWYFITKLKRGSH